MPTERPPESDDRGAGRRRKAQVARALVVTVLGFGPVALPSPAGATALPATTLTAASLTAASLPATALPATTLTAASLTAASLTAATSSGPAPAVSAAAEAAAERQAQLVAGEDQRLTEALVQDHPDPNKPAVKAQPYRFRASGFLTLVLTARRSPYTLNDVRQLAPEALVPQPGGGFLMREDIVVAEGATLTISPVKPLVIKMSSGPDGFVSLVTEGGRLRLNGTAAAPITFESWDESHGRPDRDVTDGRAYVRASGQVLIRHAIFSRLGFWSGRTGGLSVVGSGATLIQDDATSGGGAGAAQRVKQTSKGSQVLQTGKLPSSELDQGQSFSTQISDTTMTGNAFGLFVTGTSGPRITDVVIRKSLVDGLVLHRNVDSAVITNVRVEQSGLDGVVISREVEGALLSTLVAERNGRDGIVLAGRPLALGASASGSSTRPFGNNTLSGSQSLNNGGIGIHVIGGTDVRVLGNSVNGGRAGIVVSEGATQIDVSSNRVAGAASNGIQVRESREVTVTGNVVRNSPTGIHIRNSVSSLLQNSTSGVTLHAITFVGDVDGSRAESNLLAGSGTSAIDLVRATGRTPPTLRQNDTSGWSRTVTGDSLVGLLLHPLTVIWMFIALALIAMSRPRRPARTLPYPADLLSRQLQPDRRLELDQHQHQDQHQFQEQDEYQDQDEYQEQEWEQGRVPEPVAHRNDPMIDVRRTDLAHPGSDPPRRSTQISMPLAALARPTRQHPQSEPILEIVPDPAISGRAVIDLAIREARLSPASPRRRRSVGR